MKKYILWFAVGLLLQSCSIKVTKSFQFEPMLHNAAHEVNKQNACTNFMNYAPDSLHPEYMPMRYIRVRFFIVIHDVGSRNYDQQYWDTFTGLLLADINGRMRSNSKMSLPIGNNTPVLPINYQFVLSPSPYDSTDTGVKPIYDSSLAYLDKKGGPNGFYDDRLYKKHGIQRDSVLNIFMLEHHPDSVVSKTYKASTDGVGFPQWMKVAFSYKDLYQVEKDEQGNEHYPYTGILSMIMDHEFGHVLGLSHSWSGDECPDTPDNPNCWDANSAACRTTGIYSNNMMDYNNRRSALTPCQIARTQYNMATDNTTQRKLLLPVWCKYKKDATVTITDDALWQSARDLEGDVVVANGASLTLKCRVSLPAGAKIIVKPKGRLVFEGGTVTNLCNEQWQGIEVWKNKKSSGHVVMTSEADIKNYAQHCANCP